MTTSFDRAELEELGFEGFVSVRALERGCGDLPAEAGVYVILRSATEPPEFLDRSVGGWFKGKDPSVGPEQLEAKWVEGAEVLYIGRATSLRERIDQLARYARGEAVGHRGGRYLWQLADHNGLLVAWLPDAYPVGREVELVDAFVESYGVLPFANLVRPRALAAA